jgi:hypothetical protein
MTNATQDESITVTLNSFLHRIDNKEALLALFCNYNAIASRVRRSRNWRLCGQYDDLYQIEKEIQLQNNAKWLWIAKQINLILSTLPLPISRPSTPNEFLELEPNLTLAELLFKSGCTAQEARAAIDDFEMRDQTNQSS